MTDQIRIAAGSYHTIVLDRQGCAIRFMIHTVPGCGKQPQLTSDEATRLAAALHVLVDELAASPHEESPGTARKAWKKARRILCWLTEELDNGALRIDQDSSIHQNIRECLEWMREVDRETA